MIKDSIFLLIIISIIISIVCILINLKDIYYYFKSKIINCNLIWLYFKEKINNCNCKCIKKNQAEITMNNEVKIIENPIFDTVINIPLFKLSKKDKKDECVVCLDLLKKNVIQLNCDHIMHKKCWEEWNKQKKTTCPICRAEQ